MGIKFRIDRHQITEYSLIIASSVAFILLLLSMVGYFELGGHTLAYSAPTTLVPTSGAPQKECDQAIPVQQKMQTINDQLNGIGQLVIGRASLLPSTHDLSELAGADPIKEGQVKSLEGQYLTLSDQLDQIRIKYHC